MNPTIHDTYSRIGSRRDVPEIFDGDFTAFSTNCEKPVIRRECNRTYELSVLDETDLGVC